MPRKNTIKKLNQHFRKKEAGQEILVKMMYYLKREKCWMKISAYYLPLARDWRRLRLANTMAIPEGGGWGEEPSVSKKRKRVVGERIP